MSRPCRLLFAANCLTELAVGGDSSESRRGISQEHLETSQKGERELSEDYVVTQNIDFMVPRRVPTRDLPLGRTLYAAELREHNRG